MKTTSSTLQSALFELLRDGRYWLEVRAICSFSFLYSRSSYSFTTSVRRGSNILIPMYSSLARDPRKIPTFTVYIAVQTSPPLLHYYTSLKPTLTNTSARILEVPHPSIGATPVPRQLHGTPRRRPSEGLRRSQIPSTISRFGGGGYNADNRITYAKWRYIRVYKRTTPPAMPEKLNGRRRNSSSRSNKSTLHPQHYEWAEPVTKLMVGLRRHGK